MPVCVPDSKTSPDDDSDHSPWLNVSRLVGYNVWLLSSCNMDCHHLQRAAPRMNFTICGSYPSFCCSTPCPRYVSRIACGGGNCARVHLIEAFTLSADDVMLASCLFADRRNTAAALSATFAARWPRLRCEWRHLQPEPHQGVSFHKIFFEIPRYRHELCRPDSSFAPDQHIAASMSWLHNEKHLIGDIARFRAIKTLSQSHAYAQSEPLMQYLSSDC